MRIHRSVVVALWLCFEFQQYAEAQIMKPRFGMFFQMKKRLQEKVNADADSAPLEPPLEQVCINETELQAKLDHTQTLLHEKEQEASQERTIMTEKIYKLQKQLAESEKKLQDLKSAKVENVAPTHDSSVSPEELKQRLATEKEELKKEWRAKLEQHASEWQKRYEALETKFQSLQKAHEEKLAQITSQRASLDKMQNVLNTLQESTNAKKQMWEQEKLKLVASQNETMEELEKTRMDKIVVEEAFRKATEDATFWRTSFERRAFINATHVGEFADILLTMTTAPVLEVASIAYNEHLKSHHKAVNHMLYTFYYRHLAPHYNRHIKPFYNDHAADKLARTKEAVGYARTALPGLLLTSWNYVKSTATESLHSYCRVSSTYVRDEAKLSKIHLGCDLSESLVLTLFALPFVLLLGRILVWLALFPVKFLLFISPVRFSKLEVEDEQPLSVSLDANADDI